MIYLEHFEFVIDQSETGRTIKTAAGVFQECKYHKEFDHTDKLQDQDTTFEKIKAHIKFWQKTHYGLVVIYLENQGEEDMPKKIIISNRSSFINHMLLLGMLVKKQRNKVLLKS